MGVELPFCLDVTLSNNIIIITCFLSQVEYKIVLCYSIFRTNNKDGNNCKKHFVLEKIKIYITVKKKRINKELNITNSFMLFQHLSQG